MNALQMWNIQKKKSLKPTFKGLINGEQGRQNEREENVGRKEEME